MCTIKVERELSQVLTSHSHLKRVPAATPLFGKVEGCVLYILVALLN